MADKRQCVPAIIVIILPSEVMVQNLHFFLCGRFFQASSSFAFHVAVSWRWASKRWRKTLRGACECHSALNRQVTLSQLRRGGGVSPPPQVGGARRRDESLPLKPTTAAAFVSSSSTAVAFNQLEPARLLHCKQRTKKESCFFTGVCCSCRCVCVAS